MSVDNNDVYTEVDDFQMSSANNDGVEVELEAIHQQNFDTAFKEEFLDKLQRQQESNFTVKFSEDEVAKLNEDIKTEFEAKLLLVERKWSDKMAACEIAINQLESEKSQLLNNVDDMRSCVIEYEKTLQQVIEEKCKEEMTSKPYVQKCLAERDQAVGELATVKKAFGDLHRRFEKSKQIIDSQQQNEEALKKALQEAMDKLKQSEQKYEAMKLHAEERLAQVSHELDKTVRAKEGEVAKLHASIKKTELLCQSYENQLAQKIFYYLITTKQSLPK